MKSYSVLDYEKSGLHLDAEKQLYTINVTIQKQALFGLCFVQKS